MQKLSAIYNLDSSLDVQGTSKSTTQDKVTELAGSVIPRNYTSIGSWCDLATQATPHSPRRTERSKRGERYTKEKEKDRAPQSTNPIHIIKVAYVQVKYV